MSQTDPNGCPATDAEPTAAELFDPVAFARRVAEARERRSEVLARRFAPEDADLPPKPTRLIPIGTMAPAPQPAAEAAAPPRPVRLHARLGQRPLTVFGVGLATGFVAAAVLAGQLLFPAPAPAPSGLMSVASLPEAQAAPRPDLPGAAAPAARAALPDWPGDPRRVAAVLPAGGAAAPPRARPADLVQVAAAPASVVRARRAGPAPGIPRLLDRMVADTARAAATLVRDLRRVPAELTRPASSRPSSRSTRGKHRR